MAAPLRSVFVRIFSHNLSTANRSVLSTRLLRRSNLFGIRTAYRNVHSRRVSDLCRVGMYVGAGVCIVGGVSAFSYFSSNTPVSAAKSGTLDLRAKPTRMIRSKTDGTGLKLMLYQYQSCPFCCKVRAYLDYHGFSYDVVEVNSVWRSEIRWSKYKKVPIMLCGRGDDDPESSLQLNDSSLIISLLESFLYDPSRTVSTLLSYYPVMESKNSRGKTIYEYPNKYFIMFGEGVGTDKQKEERRWRQWTDDVLIHTLSPNIYRTPAEALQAFRHFSDVGEWSSTFGTFQRLFVIYVGASAMYVIGKILKRRYRLKDDVRESLYDACNEWTSALRKSGEKFMGGDCPNLADLAVYGVLSAIEGCDAFSDLVARTDISRWYHAVKSAVAINAGEREAVATENQLHAPA